MSPRSIRTSLLGLLFIACVFTVQSLVLAQEGPSSPQPPAAHAVEGITSPNATANVVANPSFENGESQWIQNNEAGIECDRIGNFKPQTGVSAYHGSEYLWVGATCEGVQLYVNNAKQMDVAIPSKNPVLTFYYYMDRTEPDDANLDDDIAYVKLTGDIIWEKRMTRANNTNGWVRAEVPLDDYAGKTKNLKMSGRNFGAITGGSIYYDQISITSGTPSSPTPTPAALPAPTLYAIDNADHDGTYTLYWSAVSGANSFELRESKNGGPWNPIHTGPQTSKGRVGLAHGQWCYKVRASNNSGVSEWSTQRCTTVVSTPSPTSTPVSSTLPAPTLYNIDNSDHDGAYTVYWSAVSGAGAYELQEKKDSGGWNTIHNDSSRSKSRSGRAQGQWCYKVRALDGARISSWSTVRCATVNPGPPDPRMTTGVRLPLVLAGYANSSVTADISPVQETNADGQATFQLPGGTVRVTVAEENWGVPLPDMQLQVISENGKAFVIMADPAGNYYPQMKEIDVTSLNSGESGEFFIEAAIVAVVALEGYNIYKFVQDLPEIEKVGLGWVDVCWTPAQVSNFVDVSTGAAGLLKLKAELAEHFIIAILKVFGEAASVEIVGDFLEAFWCENDLPSPFRARFSYQPGMVVPLMHTTLEPCGQQESTCPASSGHVFGQVTDATTGRAISGVEILFPYRRSIFELTNWEGNYSTRRAPSGYSTIVAQVEGFSPQSRVVYIPDGGEVELNFSLSPYADDKEIRAVLTWGQSPRDLDAHLWLPPATPYHLYYRNKGNISAFPWAELDIDDRDSFGPETITFRMDKVDGKYKLAVYQYSGDGDIADSRAVVSIYRADRGLRTINVSDAQGSGRWWYVADIEPYRTFLGTWWQKITVVNRLQNTSPGQ